MDHVITSPQGEDIYYYDLLAGIDTLPRRQRQAFELICLRGFTETAARDVLMPNSKSSTPVQSYADMALDRMIAAYDAKQEGRPGEDQRGDRRGHGDAGGDESPQGRLRTPDA